MVRHMGHMFMQIGSKPLDPNMNQIANDLVRFFDNQRLRSSVSR